MEKLTFELRKMRAEIHQPVLYFLQDREGTEHRINNWIGKTVHFRFTGTIYCLGCGSLTKKSFAQGYCYTCLQTHPDTEECVLHPEQCKAHLGIARNLEVATENHLAPHYVYLSYTSNTKVGVTRQTQIPTRWIDQGALQAIKLLKVPNRHIAGVAEVFLKNFYSDKSAWQKMLQTDKVDANLLPEKQAALGKLPAELKQYALEDDEIVTLTYPVPVLQEGLKTLNLDTQPEFQGILTGIKGQYLIFDGLYAINIRKYGGYRVVIEVG